MSELSLDRVAEATRTIAKANAKGFIWYRDFPQQGGGVRLALVAPAHATLITTGPMLRHTFKSREAMVEYVAEVGAVVLGEVNNVE